VRGSLWLLVVSFAGPALGAPVSGLCPDGSGFIVQDASQIPCSRAKLVEASEFPPMRPYLLPRPYPWLVDQQLRDPQNPYNLIDAAEKVRAARRDADGASREAAGSAAEARRSADGAPGLAHAPPPPRLDLRPQELEDLVSLVALRQQMAPAELLVSDAQGGERLRILLAHSEAFEAQLLQAVGRPAEDWKVVLFVAAAREAFEFHPNFFVVQGSATFRPDPADPAELGFLVGRAGEVPDGELVAGYFIFPSRFELEHSLELYWNDRSIDAVLEPRS
jgi:hypothetical protein